MKAILKWVAAIPSSLALLWLLQMIPVWMASYASQVELKFTLLNLILGLFVAGILLGSVSLWFAAVFMGPSLICGTLTGRPQIALTIVGTVFSLLQVVYLASLWKLDGMGILFVYNILFPLLVLFGLFAGAASGGLSDSKAGSPA
jgi:hypothetical protein